MHYADSRPKTSTARLEAAFFSSLSFTILTSYYGFTSPPFALSLVVLSFGLLLLLWPKGKTQLFSHARSTCARYKSNFLELCAVVYILCASVSLYERIRAGDFRSDIALMLLREQAITAMWKTDLTACAAIVIAHLTGHHDICDRIHQRILWFGKQIHLFCTEMLQEPDLESQFVKQGVGRHSINPVATSLPKRISAEKACCQSSTCSTIDAGLDRSSLQDQFRYLRSLSTSLDSYDFVQKELKSVGAQLRWSALRYRLGFQKRPLQDFHSLASSQARGGTVAGSKEHSKALGSILLEASPRARRALHKARSPSFSSIVTKAMDNQGHGTQVHGNQPLQPFDTSDQLQEQFAGRSNLMSTPIFQLPGQIENFCIKALPDTGSSQNVIDEALVQTLFPSIPVHPVHESTDKPLIAPDGQPIPCIGKVRLSWIFKDEDERHKRWFYIVENCSKGVIIGNGFLRQTETMGKHRHRLELTKPSDPNSPPSHLGNEGVCKEAQQDQNLRQLVLGRINSTDTFASLDTGCEANLMSVDYANTLGLVILPLPTLKQRVKYADGRRGPMLGHVEVDWSFFDTPDKPTKVTFYVLHSCIHPVIFGERFIFSEDPWFNHEGSLSNVHASTAEIGVVGLEKMRRFWGLLGTYRPSMFASEEEYPEPMLTDVT